MFQEVVSKESIRKIIKRKKIPPKLFLHVTCDKLFDILLWNGLDKKYRVMDLTYSFWFKEISPKTGLLTGVFTLRR